MDRGRESQESDGLDRHVEVLERKEGVGGGG